MQIRRDGFRHHARRGRARWTHRLVRLLLSVGAPLATALAFAQPAYAQFEAPADQLQVAASEAATWRQGDTSVLQLEGPVTIEFGKNKLSAQQAVIWITPVRGIVDQNRVEIALIGEAKIEQPAQQITRTGRYLFIDGLLRGRVLMQAPRVGGDRTESDLYQQAQSIRPVLIKGSQPTGRWLIEEEPAPPTTLPTTRPSDFTPLQPVTIAARELMTTQTEEGNVAAVLSGGVTLLQRTLKGELIELQAERAVLFTPFKSLASATLAEQTAEIQKAVTGAYLEGDVRITMTPAVGGEADQRLLANRAFYDFTTDRAVLTDVVLYTYQGLQYIPIVVRAEKVRQVSMTDTVREYTAEKARLSTSSFATPSYSIGTSSAYLRQTPSEDPLKNRTTFVARDTTFNIGEVPVFYLPAAAGSVAERNVFRGIETSSSRGFGFGIATEWGLFESFGRLPPPGVDVSYNLDYFSDRGPAFGLQGQYQGGWIDDSTLEPWSYEGRFTSYLAFDHGVDDLGARRADVEPDDDTRGRFYVEHQQFLPGDWQVQLSGGYISDETFLEEWFNTDFRTSRPLDTALYAKRQRDTEAFTFLVSYQPNDFVTVSELYQEQFEVERLPEISYRRIGDSWGDDRLTFFSANTLSRLEFNESDASLADLGFLRGRTTRSPGIPSIGQTGTADDPTYRGDFRQEIDWPFSVGEFRVVPYVVGRYTGYSESAPPDGSAEERLHAAAGARVTTAFWKTDDSVESRLFDLNRLRHVVEPELNLYASAQSQDRVDLLIYDEPIDAINDISAVQYAFRQRWQTKRGGPGRWRSVDFFTLNLEYNHFFNAPDERELSPEDFRGLFFVSNPEASVPRNSVNADAVWLVSDALTLNGDVQYNTEQSQVATAAVGLRVNQDPRLSYFLGFRYIGLDIDEIVNGARFIFKEQELAIFGIDYQLTTNYRVNFAHSYDFVEQRTYRSTASLVRRFDRFYASVSLRADRIEDENAVFFNLWPEGLTPGASSQSARGVFAN